MYGDACQLIKFARETFRKSVRKKNDIRVSFPNINLSETIDRFV